MEIRKLTCVGTVAAIATGLLLSNGLSAARAETDLIRFSQQFGMNYLMIHTVLDKGLIAKHAKALGIPVPKTKLYRFSGGSAIIDALISNSIDIAAGGTAPMLKVWDKTKGQVKGIMPLADMDMRLNTIDPNVKTLRDYLGDYKYKISVPSVKVSFQAVVLQMAAEKEFGDPEKLDHLTVGMRHPDVYAAMMSGKSEVKSHFGNMPYQYLEEKSGKVRTIVSSYDVFGGVSNGTTVWTTKKWKDDNPKTFLVVAKALDESVDIINSDLKAAAELYVRFTKSKYSVDEIHEMLKSGYITYTKVPKSTKVVADFLLKRGAMKTKLNSWKDAYWEYVHDLDGS